MCGRFYVDDETIKEIEKIIKKIDNRLKAKTKQGDVYPTNQSPVLQEENNDIVLSNMIWGVPQYNRKGVIFNARSETALEKRTFADSMKYRRCLVPVKGFYEWDKSKNRIAFERPDEQVMLLAGIWNLYGLNKRFTIITTAANESMIPVHDRMPLIIEPEESEIWIKDDKSTEFLLHKPPKELSIVSGDLQYTLNL
ncbi:MAG TPA: DUF159 family protein [Clostridiales bacterium]|nr:DUF159 family protein [Lachnospiraceae bacterium]HCS75449.1 DUF159 family protein [Clostridiales bacterium]